MKFITQSSESINFNAIEQYLNDTDLLSILKTHDIYIAGGAILSCMANSPINDIDLYFPNEYDFWYVKNYFRKLGYSPSFNSESAISYDTHAGHSIQLIKYCTGESIENILKQFDFTVCQMALSLKNNELILHENAISEYSTKMITISPYIMSPISSLYRVCKYVEKGYYFSQRELFRLAIRIAASGISTYRDLLMHSTALGHSLVSKFNEYIENECKGEYDSNIEPDVLINLIEQFLDSNPPDVENNNIAIPAPQSLSQETIDRINREIVPNVRPARHGSGNYPPRRSPARRVRTQSWQVDTAANEAPF